VKHIRTFYFALRHIVYCIILLFYARKQLLLSARLSHRNSVRPSVCPSVCHTGRSVKSGAS